MPQGFVYILGSDSGTLYIGVTSQLGKRILQHKSGRRSMFTGKYGVDRLLYVEQFEDIRNAIMREKSLRGITRAKKLALIREKNPEFRDLAQTLGWLPIGPEQSIEATDAALADPSPVAGNVQTSGQG
jgi:putative endonuclease